MTAWQGITQCYSNCGNYQCVLPQGVKSLYQISLQPHISFNTGQFQTMPSIKNCNIKNNCLKIP